LAGIFRATGCGGAETFRNPFHIKEHSMNTVWKKAGIGLLLAALLLGVGFTAGSTFTHAQPLFSAPAEQSAEHHGGWGGRGGWGGHGGCGW